MSSLARTNERDFEKKYQAFLDRFYRARGFAPERIDGAANRKGDVRLRKGGKSYLVEEKGLRKHEALAFEIIQDARLLARTEARDEGHVVPANCLGNQFTTEAPAQVWYCEQNEVPCAIYQVITAALRQFFFENFRDFKAMPVMRGYGLTYCVFIPWGQLLAGNIAKRIWTSEEKLA